MNTKYNFLQAKFNNRKMLYVKMQHEIISPSMIFKNSVSAKVGQSVSSSHFLLFKRAFLNGFLLSD